MGVYLANEIKGLAISDNFLAEKRGSLGVKLQKSGQFYFINFFFYNFCSDLQKDLSQFQRKSAHAPQKELPKRKL